MESETCPHSEIAAKEPNGKASHRGGRALSLWNRIVMVSVMLATNRGHWLALAHCLIAPRLGAADLNPANLAELDSHGSLAGLAPFVESNFPFFSSVLDARRLGPGWPTNNLTPRGLILPLGHDCWVCFDIDLVRVAAIWSGKGVTPVSMSQGSYHISGTKAQEGQDSLPRPDGEPWLANGIYPGWQTDAVFSTADPRPPGPDPTEVGRGPLDRKLAHFRGIRLTAEGVVVEYTVQGRAVRERITARLQPGSSNTRSFPVVERSFYFEKILSPLWLALGRAPLDKAKNVSLRITQPTVASAALRKGPADRSTPGWTNLADGTLLVRLLPQPTSSEFAVTISREPAAGANAIEDQPAFVSRSLGSIPPPPTTLRWPQMAGTSMIRSGNQNAFVLDHFPLPFENPWRRNVRLADIAFFADGRAAAVTFDGDVWLISGLGSAETDKGSPVRWKRFASGLHEPLSLCLRDGDVLVFDRNGIWRLLDHNNDGEADYHELFSNAFGQTAETREFATGMRLAPDGSLVLSKGGQQSSTLGIHNGTVLRVAPDGTGTEILGHGLRMPFIGVHPVTGLVTASDQQGHYVPATALHLIQGGQFYGFISLILPKEVYPAPIADPLTWIPHPINASGASQVWLAGARMGPLNDALVHLGYYRPEIFLVRSSQRSARPHAAVVSMSRDLDFPLLNGAVNPADGQLYVTGFRIWGTESKRLSGLARLRYTGVENTLPREVVAMQQGVLLRFDTPLDAVVAANPANYSADVWNYRRSAAYGSPHYRLDGTKGQDTLMPSSAYLSADGRSVFIGFPGIRPAMQMRVGFSLTTASGRKFEQNAYLTPHELPLFNPLEHGFRQLEVDLTPRAAAAAESTPITAAEGERLAGLMGCVACHSTDGSTLGKVGPSWKGMFGGQRRFADGQSVIANENYLRESIREPGLRVVAGFEKSDTGMPSYEGVLTPTQIEALLAYLKTL